MVFSDEKKFNLDGLNGSQYYWNDLRKEKQLFSKRQFGRGSVVVRVAFTASGKANSVMMAGKQNSARYINVLEKKSFTIYELSKQQ